jgi:hypothetical protein
VRKCRSIVFQSEFKSKVLLRYLQKQAENEAKAAAKRNKKAEESRAKASEGDPFGGGLIDSTVLMSINGNADDDDD